METFFTLATLREQLKTTLGFDSVDTLTTWLDSDGVKPFKEEFFRDHLSADSTATANTDGADYAKVTNLLGVNSIMNFAVYSMNTPDKKGWSAEKHWVRFIWQMGQFAKTHDETAWKAPERKIWKSGFGTDTRWSIS
ncbi:hypothetical protein PG984_000168 [Apiospora sp. TS-2023a]